MFIANAAVIASEAKQSQILFSITVIASEAKQSQILFSITVIANEVKQTHCHTIFPINLKSAKAIAEVASIITGIRRAMQASCLPLTISFSILFFLKFSVSC